MCYSAVFAHGALVVPSPHLWKTKDVLKPFLLTLSLSLLAGCASAPPNYIWVHNLSDQVTARPIEPGDTVGVVVKGQAELSGKFTVLENGSYTQPVVGQVQVEGLTEAEASKRQANLLKGIVVKPMVSITVTRARPVTVSVIGEVGSGGQQQVLENETILSVLARSGGLSPFANQDMIFVVRKNPELKVIRFRYDDLVAGEPRSTYFKLRDGDVIVVR